ncbi:hypothetical protein CP972_15335 [Streptomyces prasinus]|uniref:Uncharacterized protein n=1 Tax=Streptomyces prasinus TaxID=67345 RepID=A0ABX6AWJ6_9ACTN|nr:hypothetical protein CP972_15335 [Streptomyces prasinus]
MQYPVGPQGGEMPSGPAKDQVRPGAEGDPTGLSDPYGRYVRERALPFDTTLLTPRNAALDGSPTL